MDFIQLVKVQVQAVQLIYFIFVSEESHVYTNRTYVVK